MENINQFPSFSEITNSVENWADLSPLHQCHRILRYLEDKTLIPAYTYDVRQDKPHLYLCYQATGQRIFSILDTAGVPEYLYTHFLKAQSPLWTDYYASDPKQDTQVLSGTSPTIAHVDKIVTDSLSQFATDYMRNTEAATGPIPAYTPVKTIKITKAEAPFKFGTSIPPRFLICRETPELPGCETIYDTHTGAWYRISKWKLSEAAGMETFINTRPRPQGWITGYRIALDPLLNNAKVHYGRQGEHWVLMTLEMQLEDAAAFLTAHISQHPESFLKFKI